MKSLFLFLFANIIFCACWIVYIDPFQKKSHTVPFWYTDSPSLLIDTT